MECKAHSKMLQIQMISGFVRSVDAAKVVQPLSDWILTLLHYEEDLMRPAFDSLDIEFNTEYILRVS